MDTQSINLYVDENKVKMNINSIIQFQEQETGLSLWQTLTKVDNSNLQEFLASSWSGLMQAFVNSRNDFLTQVVSSARNELELRTNMLATYWEWKLSQAESSVTLLSEQTRSSLLSVGKGFENFGHLVNQKFTQQQQKLGLAENNLDAINSFLQSPSNQDPNFGSFWNFLEHSFKKILDSNISTLKVNWIEMLSPMKKTTLQLEDMLSSLSGSVKMLEARMKEMEEIVSMLKDDGLKSKQATIQNEVNTERLRELSDSHLSLNEVVTLRLGSIEDEVKSVRSKKNTMLEGFVPNPEFKKDSIDEEIRRLDFKLVERLSFQENNLKQFTSLSIDESNWKQKQVTDSLNDEIRKLIRSQSDLLTKVESLDRLTKTRLLELESLLKKTTDEVDDVANRLMSSSKYLEDGSWLTKKLRALDLQRDCPGKFPSVDEVIALEAQMGSLEANLAKLVKLQKHSTPFLSGNIHLDPFSKSYKNCKARKDCTDPSCTFNHLCRNKLCNNSKCLFRHEKLGSTHSVSIIGSKDSPIHTKLDGGKT